MKLKGKQKRIRIDTRIPPNDRMRLEELACYLDVSISVVTRVAIKAFLDQVYTEEGYIRDEVREAILKTRNQ